MLQNGQTSFILKKQLTAFDKTPCKYLCNSHSYGQKTKYNATEQFQGLMHMANVLQKARVLVEGVDTSASQQAESHNDVGSHFTTQ